MNLYKSISISGHNYTEDMPLFQKIQLAVVGLGFLIMLLAAFNFEALHSSWWLLASLGMIIMGTIGYGYGQYSGTVAGIKNNHVWQASLSSRGVIAWILGVFLTGFYVVLYWYPQFLGLGVAGAANTGLVGFFDPLSRLLKGQPASQWFMYGALYTIAIVTLGMKFIYKYRHSQYQVFRTISIMFFQTIFAFLLPELLLRLNIPSNDFKNVWPLNYNFFFDWHIDEMIKAGMFGYFILFWGIIMFLIITPILTYFYGKRWYCSWVCGCGGLAESAGDSFRQLSDKSLKAWKIERWMVHSVLVFVFLMTAMVLYTRFSGNSRILFLDSYQLSSWYGFLIGAAFSGVVGVGFYPLLGGRVWCRFGCPMAAYLGLLQRINTKFKIGKKDITLQAKFRITTNGSQCISCGNCSTFCEMGIDVKAYAQRQEDILRSSCVGCGVCSAVCPRGVLRLENL